MTATTNPALLAHDERMAAFVAGYEQGLSAKVDLIAEQRAHELLHNEAAAALGFAVRTAHERHGPAWAALIEQQGGGDE